MSEPTHHILSVLVQNRPGVLARVAGLFARRGYNIFSLAVAPAEEEGRSRITIVVDVESAPLEQVVKQLFKLIDVIKISELDPRWSVERELLLATVRVDAELRSQVLELVNVFEGKILAVGSDALTLSLEGRRGAIDDGVRRRPRPLQLIQCHQHQRLYISIAGRLVHHQSQHFRCRWSCLRMAAVRC